MPSPTRISASLFATLFFAFALLNRGDAADAFPGKVSDFHSFTRYDFTQGGRRCIVVAPDEVAEGKPWVWRARFFGHEPQTDIALLEHGYHVAYVDVANLFGSPMAVEVWTGFYDYLIKKHGFHRRPALEGMSRGGLIIFNWAKAHPGQVSCIYGDAPVCDFKSWPGGKGVGKGGGGAWQTCLKAYGLTEAAAMTAKVNPVDGLQSLATARVPILNVVGDADVVVPVVENTAIFEERYAKLNGPIEVLHKPGIGHHPHSLKDPQVIVDFILKNRRDVTIVLAGDSTVTASAGWGGAFAERFGSRLHVILGGASSKSFRDAGIGPVRHRLRILYHSIRALPIVLERSKAGNGSCNHYRQNLERYVAETQLEAQPALVSPMTRRRFRMAGSIPVDPMPKPSGWLPRRQKHPHRSASQQRCCSMIWEMLEAPICVPEETEPISTKRGQKRCLIC